MPHSPPKFGNILSPWAYAQTHPSPSSVRRDNRLPKAKEIVLAASDAWPIARSIADELTDFSPTSRVEIVGSLRRQVKECHDIDILVSPDNEYLHKHITKMGYILSDGPQKTSIVLIYEQPSKPGEVLQIQVDFRYAPSDEFGPTLAYFTGSREHNISMRRIAQHQYKKLNEHGLFDVEGNRLDHGDEREIYSLLGLEYFPPRARNGFIEYGEDIEDIKSLEAKGICHSCGRKHRTPHYICQCCFDCIYLLENKYNA